MGEALLTDQDCIRGETTESYRSLFEEAPVAYQELNLDGTIVRVNRAACELLGYSVDEMVGQPVWNFVSEAERQNSRETVQRKLRTERRLVSFERQYARRDGEILLLQIYENYIRGGSGAVIGIRSVLLDITERDRMERALREAERKYRDLFESSVVGMFRTSAQGRILAINTALMRMLGYSGPEEAPAVVDFERQLYVVLSRRAEIHRLLAENKNVSEFECECYRKDRSTVWLFVQARAVRDAKGDILYCEGSAENITERKRAVQALQESEERLRLIAETSDEIFYIRRPDTHSLLYVNPAYERIWGRSLQSLYEQPHSFLEAIHPQDVKRVIAALEITNPPEPFNQEFRIVRPNGLQRWIWAREFTVRDTTGHVTCLVGVAQDMTQRKQAEEQLRLSEERYCRFFEEDLAANYIAGPGGEIACCNPAFAAMFGFASPDEAILENLSSLYTVPESGREFLDLLREEHRLKHHAKDMRRRDGVLLHVLENAVGHFDRDGRLVEIRGYLIDDTERRQKEDALVRQTAELVRSNSELEQFAYVASHDLQEPLRMVSSYTQLLAKRYCGKLGPDADEFIGYAKDGAVRMQQLINDLLEYSRLGTRAGALQQTDSGVALAVALENLRAAIDESQAVIAQGNMPSVCADRVQLGQLFQNLIGNAIKFRGPGPAHIQVAGEEIENAWHFWVTDDGIGLDPKYAARIFQVFQRLHSKTAYPGTGIGLAICKKIVEQHGGRMWVESQPGQGATFHFTIARKKGKLQ